MRGERRKPDFIAGHIVNSNGEIKYHLIPALWLKVVAGIFTLLILVALILFGMVLFNRADLQDLRIKTIGTDDNANTSNISR